MVLELWRRTRMSSACKTTLRWRRILHSKHNKGNSRSCIEYVNTDPSTRPVLSGTYRQLDVAASSFVDGMLVVDERGKQVEQVQMLQATGLMQAIMPWCSR